VPRPDPPSGRPLPPGRPRLPRLRSERCPKPGRLRLHLRPSGRRGGRLPLRARDRSLQPLRPGLRRAGRLPARHPSPGSDRGDRQPERQRIRGGLDAVLGPTPALLGGSVSSERGAVARTAHPRDDDLSV
ncbi:MAG: Hydrolase, alpha/beta fold family, partial [uncultured Thermomicrobiales bacterium]